MALLTSRSSVLSLNAVKVFLTHLRHYVFKIPSTNPLGKFIGVSQQSTVTFRRLISKVNCFQIVYFHSQEFESSFLVLAACGLYIDLLLFG